MYDHCDSVAERVALGEPLAELDEHVSSCPRCQRLVAMPAQLGGTRHSVDPGLGFSARMTVGAQHRIVVRRRRRIAAGLAATVAAGMVGIFAFTREPEPPPAQLQPAVAERLPIDEPVELAEDDLSALVELADTKRSSRMSAHWARIYKPLAPYKKLVEDEGETP
ncbi:MAG TPA: hypothetical protein VFO79_01210 [Xanthomonadales bacterium]|nr:hypothetical protein [Xanthomonadales bacterium]